MLPVANLMLLFVVNGFVYLLLSVVVCLASLMYVPVPCHVRSLLRFVVVVC